jgi:hypothetical protein
MENEELAALRATLLAAQRQPLALKVRQARLSALLAAGDDLLPYVLSASCSDPRDRVCRRAELCQLRVLEGGSDLAHLAAIRRPGRRRYEPAPARPIQVALAAAILVSLCLLVQLLISLALLHLR